VSDRALVRNAADPQQVRRAARKERELEEQFLEALRVATSTPEGRLVFRTLLEKLGVYRSVWEPSAKIHYNAGRQDAGHELQAYLLQASEEHYDQMEREARFRAARLNRETDAVHTARAEGVHNG
jgi:hypothetical protein